MRNDYVTSFKDNTLKVTEEVAATYNLLSDYLVTKGYIVVENTFASDRDKRFQIRNMQRTSINADQSPVVFLDGVRLTDLVVLSGARMSDFEEVVIDRSGYNLGVQGTNGVIRLERRRTPIFNKATTSSVSPEDVIYYHTVQKGFEAPKQFYTPKFAFYKSKTFKQIGTIAWFSNLSVPPNQSVKIQIPNTGLRDMTFYIEGIAEDGSLINIEKTIQK